MKTKYFNPIFGKYSWGKLVTKNIILNRLHKSAGKRKIERRNERMRLLANVKSHSEQVFEERVHQPYEVPRIRGAPVHGLEGGELGR